MKSSGLTAKDVHVIAEEHASDVKKELHEKIKSVRDGISDDVDEIKQGAGSTLSRREIQELVSNSASKLRKQLQHDITGLQQDQEDMRDALESVRHGAVSRSTSPRKGMLPEQIDAFNELVQGLGDLRSGIAKWTKDRPTKTYVQVSKFLYMMLALFH